MKVGARGCVSSLSMMNPALVLRMYDAARTGDWEAAGAVQEQVDAFFKECESFVAALAEGTADPVIDKAFAVASGFLTGSARCRAPYIGWSDRSVGRAREWLCANHRDFIAPT
jgi:dihydrodipicolinate synthase/N-acetylneuraminate lyase